MPLPRSTPTQQGVRPGAVLALLDSWESNPEIEMHSLMVVRHGHVVAEGWWAPYTPDRRHLLYSISKSFTTTALAFAVAEGLVDLDGRVIDHFPHLDAEVSDGRSRAMTLRHLASMASGHDRDMFDEVSRRDPGDLVRGFLSIPPDGQPGSVFAYSQPCTYTVASVVERAAGMSLTDYLRPRLLDPLGIGDVGWLAWPEGHQLGFSGLYARTEDVAKLGVLYLDGGRWGDRRLVPQEWVEQATSAHVATSQHPEVDWQQGYGYGFWRSRHGYRGDGAFGQFCLVLPAHDTVVATTGGTEAMQAVLDAVWTHLLPGLGGSGADPAAEHELSARLAGLRLPPVVGAATPPDAASALDRPLEVAAASPFALFSSELTSVAMDRDADGWLMTLRENGNELVLPVGSGDWAVSTPLDRKGGAVPVAASGGWDGDVLGIEVRFLETPHTMSLSCSLREDVARASWRHLPLHGTALELLHSPA
jgi:CubicO group peptidase (beta-lactamase class C family)